MALQVVSMPAMSRRPTVRMTWKGSGHSFEHLADEPSEGFAVGLR